MSAGAAASVGRVPAGLPSRAPSRPSIYLCDLAPGISEEELRELVGLYGKVRSFEHFDEACEETAVVEYVDCESAEEAQRVLNFASVRGKTCRCLFLDALEQVCSSAGSEQRLVVERLDPGVDSRGLRDLCSLFGEVLDSKVELDDNERSRGYGFACFARAEDLRKAQELLSGMQVGASTVEVRPYMPADAARFTGCQYAAGYCLSAASQGKTRPPRTTPRARAEAALQHFRQLQYNYVEAIGDVQQKLQRLRALVELYEPNQDTQMVVVAQTSNLPAVAGVLRGCCEEEADVEVLDSGAAAARRASVIEGFETGNVYVLVVASEVASAWDFALGATAAVLVNFDLPPTVAQLQYRILKRTHGGSRVHNFLQTAVDRKLVVPLLAALEDSGHEIPRELMEMWSDQ